MCPRAFCSTTAIFVPQNCEYVKPLGPVMRLGAVCQSCHHQFGVVLLTHAEQFLQKRDRRPKVLVAVIVPRRHARHLDAVLQGPEQLRRRVMRRCIR